MKPNPLSSLNHLTVPVAIVFPPALIVLRTRRLLSKGYERWHCDAGRIAQPDVSTLAAATINAHPASRPTSDCCSPRGEASVSRVGALTSGRRPERSSVTAIERRLLDVQFVVHPTKERKWGQPPTGSLTRACSEGKRRESQTSSSRPTPG